MVKLDNFSRASCPERVALSELPRASCLERIVSGLVLNAGERGAVFRMSCEERTLSRLAYTAPHRRCEWVALALTRGREVTLAARRLSR